MVCFRCRVFLEISFCVEWVILCDSEVLFFYLIVCFLKWEMKIKIDGGM